jgi:hypothetical protein
METKKRRVFSAAIHQGSCEKQELSHVRGNIGNVINQPPRIALIYIRRYLFTLTANRANANFAMTNIRGMI